MRHSNTSAPINNCGARPTTIIRCVAVTIRVLPRTKSPFCVFQLAVKRYFVVSGEAL
jgi:hypothetical protein